jgi:hypothetical protein
VLTIDSPCTMIKNHYRNSLQALLLQRVSRSFAPVLTGLLVLFLSGCAVHENTMEENASLHVIVDTSSSDLETVFAPVFVLSGQQESYNRIGRVLAEKVNGHEEISIDPNQPVIYAGRFPFSTQRGVYLNLVYRVHFQKTPFSLIPFHLAAGNNVGLLVIVTLNEEHIPLLVTTVNTCGCYTMVIPTGFLPDDAYPEDWDTREHYFYGEVLPTGVPAYNSDDALLITVRPKVHRVMDVNIFKRKKLLAKEVVVAEMMSLQSLKTLPLENGEVTSFYYDQWPLQGHVKGSIKPWESLLLSLVSLDFYVGMDKEYGDTKQSGNSFHTSIFPWNRQASDMNDFGKFLGFWGWRL